MTIFLDTNVLLDLLLRREPFHAHAARLLDRVEAGQVVAYVSAITFNNIFYIARREVKADRAREMVRAVRRLCRAVPLDEGVIDQALALTVRDFEDAIQAVSAGRVHTPYIVTRNARDFEGSGLQAFSPEEALALLDAPPSSPAE